MTPHGAHHSFMQPQGDYMPNATTRKDGAISTAAAASLADMQPSVAQLVEEALRRREGELADSGALVVRTGKYTGRSPDDKFIVDDYVAHELVDWGKSNQPFDSERFDRLYDRVIDYVAELPTHYVFDGFGGADPQHGLHIRVVSEYAWHSLFAHQLFIRPENVVGRATGPEPDFTIIDAANFKAVPERDGTKSETFIILNFSRRIVLIGGTEYAGEIKKSVFSILNFLLPQSGVFPMHCSANIDNLGRTALFFGLSGTGKTTLSTDPNRGLIGDDEHGWSDSGIFNFEGGCYAKCIDLSEASEPQIWSAIRHGAVLENVVLDAHTRTPRYADKSLTENTRAAYPLEFIPHAVIPSVGGHPDTVIFLTADAFGVLPPVSRLSEDQAMYHFLSGYTSKLAGTERGITEPRTTFSTCFGAPFLPLPAVRYAAMLGERLREHAAACYLINTGWTGGPYGVGDRMDLAMTRRIVNAALSGELKCVGCEPDPVFRVSVPRSCPGVPPEILQPRNTWRDREAYDRAANDLAMRFRENFKQFGSVPASIQSAGPVARQR
jgi:phosphoenolpyruvate carboxykinase (ATP)